jgi:hypothetical protein
MTAEHDIYRAAKLVIDQQGNDAGDFAARRADVLMEEGDAEGAVGSCACASCFSPVIRTCPEAERRGSILQCRLLAGRCESR